MLALPGGAERRQLHSSGGRRMRTPCCRRRGILRWRCVGCKPGSAPSRGYADHGQKETQRAVAARWGPKSARKKVGAPLVERPELALPQELTSLASSVPRSSCDGPYDGPSCGQPFCGSPSCGHPSYGGCPSCGSPSCARPSSVQPSCDRRASSLLASFLTTFLYTRIVAPRVLVSILWRHEPCSRRALLPRGGAAYGGPRASARGQRFQSSSQDRSSEKMAATKN